MRAAAFLLGSRLRGAVSSVRRLTVGPVGQYPPRAGAGPHPGPPQERVVGMAEALGFRPENGAPGPGEAYFIAAVVLAACYWPVTVLQSWRIADPGIGYENVAERPNPERRDRRGPDEVQRRRAELRSCIASSEERRLHASREGR